MNQPQLPLDTLPAPLHPAVARHWSALLEALDGAQIELPREARLLEAAARVFATSDFVALACIRNPTLLPELWTSGDLERPYPETLYRAKLDALLGDGVTEELLASRLRQFRRREMVRIAWRELAGWAELEESLNETSWLAECCVDGALARLCPIYCERFGTPVHADGTPMEMVVIGMGKLGAWELNFSSDIDLIYAYPGGGETVGRRPIANEEFFTRLGRALTNALDTTTFEGFVFRTDLRLRPYGESGPLALSFDAMEIYYQTQGRGWERYAMIKARVVGGDRAAGEELLESLRPFVYRRYLDFGAFESLREMKALIEREVARKGMGQNIKLGPGGIREVEFIGQAFQLVHGGRNRALQIRPILPVLALLVEEGLLPAYAAHRLGAAYRFLRRVENRLQEWRDEQTQSLPEEAEGQARLAFAMGFADWEAFLVDLERHRRAVQEQFEQTFAAPQAADRDEDHGEAQLHALWRGGMEEERAHALLRETGFDDVAEVLRRLQQLNEGRIYRATGESGRRWMGRLIPLLLGATGAMEEADTVLFRVLDLIERVARRTTYLALLVENPMALSQVVKLFAASPWIATYLAHHPGLLDELLDPRSLYAPLLRAGLEEELEAQMGHLDTDDQEGQMEGLRRFKNTNVLRVAAADVSGGLRLMRVSDHLTEIAELVLARATALSRDYFTRRYGTPRCLLAGGEYRPSFAVVGYGKLGGIELGYGSDLDIVFLHDSAGEEQQSDGERPVDNAVFFARMGQRVIHLLETLTPSGVLYEVDPRLRPHGNSGALVSSLTAFTEYQRHEAWTWEHQALVRARVIVGEAPIRAAFAALREEILTRERDPAQLAGEVKEMRARMRENLDKSDADTFDLKQGHGGIIDIEFIAQYLVLAHARDHQTLTTWTDDIRILTAAEEAALLAAEEAALLRDAYRAYRADVHRLKLQEAEARVEAARFGPYRAGVARVWRRILGE